MSLNSMGLGFMFTAQDFASRIFDKVSQHFSNLDETAQAGSARIKDSFKRAALGMGVFASGALMLNRVAAVTGPAANFESAIASVGAVAGASTAQLKTLHDTALQASIDTQYSPVEAAQGLQELASAGYSVKESTELLVPVLDLAAGSLGTLSVSGAAGLASQAMHAFGIDSKDATKTVDQLMQSVNMFALSANELPLALGIASRGAGVAKQSFSDTLTAIGLVKNVVPGVERASTSVAVAMEQMVNPKTQKMLKSVGADVGNGAGGFRSLLDVLADLAPALDKMSDKKRADFLTKAFGKEAMGGIGAILGQMTNGVKNTNGELLKGGAALEYFRNQMDNAGGAAASFRDKTLSTFNGQMNMLSGSFEALDVMLGEPFIEVFKPIVSTVIDALNGVITWFKAVPASTKVFIAKIVVATGALLALTGVLIALPSLFTLLSFAVKAMAAAAWAAVAPLVPLFLGVGAALGLFYLVFKKDGEGIGAFASRMAGKVTLAFKALSQVFSSGAFSGEVMREIDRAENSGIKDFVTWVYSTAYRIEQFWNGMATGFSAAYEIYIKPALASLGGAFDGLKSSVSNLGGTLTKTFGDATVAIDPTTAASQRFTGAGESMGVTIGKVVAGVTTMVEWFTKLLDILVQVADAATTVFDSVGEFLGEGAAKIYLGVTEPIESVKREYYQMRDDIDGVRVMNINDRDQMAVQRQRAAEIDARHADANRLARPTDRYGPAPMAMPATTQVEVQVQQLQMQAAQAGMTDPALMMELVRKIDALANKPTIVQVDGETIARASASGAASSADRSFTPVATY